MIIIVITRLLVGQHGLFSARHQWLSARRVIVGPSEARADNDTEGRQTRFIFGPTPVIVGPTCHCRPERSEGRQWHGGPTITGVGPKINRVALQNRVIVIFSLNAPCMLPNSRWNGGVWHATLLWRTFNSVSGKSVFDSLSPEKIIFIWKLYNLQTYFIIKIYNIWNKKYVEMSSSGCYYTETNGRHFPDDIFKCIFLNENVLISIKISLKFDPKGQINNIPALVWIMAYHRLGDKPLSEPRMESLTHICVTRPQWALNMY